MCFNYSSGIQVVVQIMNLNVSMSISTNPSESINVPIFFGLRCLDRLVRWLMSSLTDLGVVDRCTEIRPRAAEGRVKIKKAYILVIALKLNKNETWTWYMNNGPLVARSSSSSTNPWETRSCSQQITCPTTRTLQRFVVSAVRIRTWMPLSPHKRRQIPSAPSQNSSRICFLVDLSVR